MLTMFLLCSNADIYYLDTRTKSNTYTLKGDIQDYYYDPNGNFYVQFTIEVVNGYTQAVSDTAEVNLGSDRKFY